VKLLQYWNEASNSDNIKLTYDYWLDKYEEYLRTCNKPIIDLGCGIGNNTLYLLERNYEVISCDFSEVALNRLNSQIPHAAIQHFDMREGIPFKDRSVEIVIADLSLHYFDEQTTLKILQDLHRTLEENGLLLCRLNSTKNIQEPNEFFLESGGLQRRYFNEEQINYYFDNETWDILFKSEYIMKRYSTNKVVWELSLKKKQSN
jgi:SAM-dependent methyltransferase